MPEASMVAATVPYWPRGQERVEGQHRPDQLGHLHAQSASGMRDRSPDLKTIDAPAVGAWDARVVSRAASRKQQAQRARRQHRGGPPLGMTGARITTTLLNGLRERDATLGLETMCVGGGQGMAIIFERLN